jgi:alpha-tubulin suppressor-like RCC1 family protein
MSSVVQLLYSYAPFSIGTGTAVAIQAGDSHVCILRADNTTTTTTSSSGEVLCWGSSFDGQLVRKTECIYKRSNTHTFSCCFSKVYTFAQTCAVVHSF